ncbi:MAG: ATP phosphoribosyltransferase [Corynebacterium sp.]|nr:ATP phosphoribosyltransferase [Corynebacterium sp.]
MLKIAVPNKGSLSEAAVTILTEAGYTGRGTTKALTVLDKTNNVEFFFLRPKDIAIYVANGHLDLGITGRDLAADSRAEVQEVLNLGFGSSTFRYAAPSDRKWAIADIAGKRVATSYPNLVRADLVARGIDATVIRLDGAVEISIKLGVADVIADVVSTGRTLLQHGLAPFGEPLVDSEAVVVARKGVEITPEMMILLRRIEGILHAHNFLMLDYNVEEHLLEQAKTITPGISGPTVSPLALANWVAVRAMVPRKEANAIMDQLAQLGAQAILASEIRIARL